jgi:hypothetical protein
VKTIPLTHGKVAMVDDQDYEILSKWKWYVTWNGYAARSQHRKRGKNKYSCKKVWMHREINKTPNGFITDHVNRNKLDNRRCNLRTASKSENAINTGIPRNNKSGYKGVYWEKWSGKWRAELKINRRKHRLGRYGDLQEAIDARKKAEKLYYEA